jgi:VWA domain-containing protein
MSLSFSSPWGGLVALGAVLPLAALLAAEWRFRRLRSVLALERPGVTDALPAVVALCAIPLLLGLAAAQPVLERTKTRYVRPDAEAFFVIDTSRSMLAATSAAGVTRFERARKAALKLRGSIADVPAGIASLTDRLLPHLFPSSSRSAFTETIERAVAVERPPPQQIQRRATSYFELTSLGTQNYFSDAAKRRVAVVLTDGESVPFEESELARDLRGARIRTVFVQFWNDNERVFARGGRAEPGYRPDPASGPELERLASVIGGRAFSERDLGDAAAALRAAVGSGPRVAVGRDEDPVALAPYAVLAAFVPLAFLLWLRNLWTLVRLPGRPVGEAKPV